MTSRRSFVTAFASLAGTAFAGRSVTQLEAQAPAPAAPRGATDWDMTWLDQFKGKHKQVFDIWGFDLAIDTPLRVPMNYLDAFRDVYRLEPPDVNVAVGVARISFPLNASDALWEKYTLGERWGIKDPVTGKPSTRNIFLGQATGGGATVRALQARGALFWQCNIALGAVAGMLANATKTPVAAMRAELLAGLNPGVQLVPAHALAVGLVQERGFTYERV